MNKILVNDFFDKISNIVKELEKHLILVNLSFFEIANAVLFIF